MIDLEPALLGQWLNDLIYSIKTCIQRTQMTIEIHPVISKKAKKEFINLPWHLHAHDHNWVPPLKIAVRDMLNTKKHPFYKQAKLQLWNAYRSKKCVGRIAGIINYAHNKFHEERIAFWGFFECENNPATAQAL